MLCPRWTVRNAQDRDTGDGNNPKSERLQINTNQPDIYPATLREVGPLNNNVREAPIATIMYKRMYCTTIPYQHPAPRNPTICWVGQPKGTHITTLCILGMVTEVLIVVVPNSQQYSVRVIGPTKVSVSHLVRFQLWAPARGADGIAHFTS